jgi:hypothetical protein
MLFALPPVFANIHIHAGRKTHTVPHAQLTSGFLQPHTMFLEGSHTGVATTEKVLHHFFSFCIFWCMSTLLECGILTEFTGQQLIDSFSNDKLGESCLIDFLVHCMRHDDIVHNLNRSGTGCLSRQVSM